MARKDGCRSSSAINVWSPRTPEFHTILAVSSRPHTVAPLPRPRTVSKPAQAQSRATTSAGVMSSRYPSARRFTSTLPSARPRGPTRICQGMPIRSAVANFAPGRSSSIVVKRVDALRGQLRIELFAGRIGIGAALLEIEDHDRERRHRLRPFDAGVVVEGLDDGGDQPASGRCHRSPICTGRSTPSGPVTTRLHRFGIFGAEIEDLADLDAARRDPLVGRHRANARGIVLVRGRRIERRSTCRRSACRPATSSKSTSASGHVESRDSRGGKTLRSRRCPPAR